MESPAYLHTEEALNGRRSVRRTLTFASTALLPGRVVSATIRNISQTGLLLDTPADLKVNDWLFVELMNGRVIPAEVIWTREQVAGCKFVKPIAQAEVSALLLRADPIQPEAFLPDQPTPSRSSSGRFGEPEDAANFVVIVCVAMVLAAALIFVLAVVG